MDWVVITPSQLFILLYRKEYNHHAVTNIAFSAIGGIIPPLKLKSEGSKTTFIVQSSSVIKNSNFCDLIRCEAIAIRSFIFQRNEKGYIK